RSTALSIRTPPLLPLFPYTTLFRSPELVREDGAAAMIESLRELQAEYEGTDIHIELTGPPIWTSEMLNAAVDDQVKFTIYGFALDRKSTRLNSSHVKISYAVFCLKK